MLLASLAKGTRHKIINTPIMDFKSWLSEAKFTIRGKSSDDPHEKEKMWTDYWKNLGFSDSEIILMRKKISADDFSNSTSLPDPILHNPLCQKPRKFLLKIFPNPTIRNFVEKIFNKDQLTQMIFKDLCRPDVTETDVRDAVKQLQSLGLLKDLPKNQEPTQIVTPETPGSTFLAATHAIRGGIS